MKDVSREPCKFVQTNLVYHCVKLLIGRDLQCLAGDHITQPFYIHLFSEKKIKIELIEYSNNVSSIYGVVYEVKDQNPNHLSETGAPQYVIAARSLDAAAPADGT